MFRSGVVKFVVCAAAAFWLTAGWFGDVRAQQAAIPPEWQEALDTGAQALEQGNYDEAINAYSQVIQAATALYGVPPTEAYINRAKAFEALREYRAAVQDYSAAIESEDRRYLPEALNGRGEIRLQFSGPDSLAVQEALSDFTKAVEYDRTNPTYTVNQAKALVRLGAAERARTLVNRVLKLDENNAEAYRTRAQAHALLKDFDSASADIATATKLEPDNHENHYVMGMIHMENKQHQAAVEAFHRAKATYQPEDPDNPAPYVEPFLAASLAYIELGKEARDPGSRQAALIGAIEETQKALEEQPLLPLAFLNRGVALRLLELYEDALDAFTKALEVAPEFSEAYFRRGIVWYYMDQPDLARKDFREAIAIQYDDVRPYLWIGLTYADEGSYHEAIEQYSAAINLNPSYVPAYVNRGLAYAQLGQFERALDNFNDAIRREPHEPTHHFKKGSVLMAMDRYDDAVRSFSTAISNAPYYADAYRRAGEALQRLGRTELATRYRQRANEIEAAIRDQMESYRQQFQQQSEQLGRIEDLPGTDTETVLAAAEDESEGSDGGLELDAGAGAPTLPSGPAPAAINPFEAFGDEPNSGAETLQDGLNAYP